MVEKYCKQECVDNHTQEVYVFLMKIVPPWISKTISNRFLCHRTS